MRVNAGACDVSSPIIAILSGSVIQPVIQVFGDEGVVGELRISGADAVGFFGLGDRRTVF
jgi:hypothetical protein